MAVAGSAITGLVFAALSVRLPAPFVPVTVHAEALAPGIRDQLVVARRRARDRLAVVARVVAAVPLPGDRGESAFGLNQPSAVRIRRLSLGGMERVADVRLPVVVAGVDDLDPGDWTWSRPEACRGLAAIAAEMLLSSVDAAERRERVRRRDTTRSRLVWSAAATHVRGALCTRDVGARRIRPWCHTAATGTRSRSSRSAPGALVGCQRLAHLGVPVMRRDHVVVRRRHRHRIDAVRLGAPIDQRVREEVLDRPEDRVRAESVLRDGAPLHRARRRAVRRPRVPRAVAGGDIEIRLVSPSNAWRPRIVVLPRPVLIADQVTPALIDR